jgi:tetratricopeptide (TPR) repeat protein
VRESPIQATAAAASIAALGLAVAIGVYQAVAFDGGLPGISLDYMPRIRALEASGDVEGAIRELRVATAVDAGNPGVAGVLETLALQAGDLDSRIFALRAQLRANPFDGQARVRLSRAFVEQARGAGDRRAPRILARAVWQAEQALRIDPESARARLALADALLAQGEGEKARAVLAEARRIDPSLAPPAARPGAEPR